MNKPKLRITSDDEIVSELSEHFSQHPLVARDCVRILNKIVFQIQRRKMDQKVYKDIVSLAVRGFMTKDTYLKAYLYTFLIETSKHCRHGILAINSLSKDLDDRKIPEASRNTALRALFSNLPGTMYNDFTKFVEAGLYSGSDTAVVLASEYLPHLKVSTNLKNTIMDYHIANFRSTSMSKYTAMVEMRRLTNIPYGKMISYLNMYSEPIIVYEALNGIAEMLPENAVKYLDDAMRVLRSRIADGAVHEFYSIKFLNALSINFPTKVSVANTELEGMLQSESKSVSMMALLTLLRTGDENTVKRMTKRLVPLLKTMAAKHKMVAIDTLDALYYKEAKNRVNNDVKEVYVDFLLKALYEKEDLMFKRSLLKRIKKLLEFERESTQGERIMKEMCRYIEDPEYYQLSIEILGIVGSYLTNRSQLSHIYNRLILDNDHVRKAAVQTILEVHKRGLIDDRDEIKSLCTSFSDSKLYGEFFAATMSVGMEELKAEEIGEIGEDVFLYVDKEKEGERKVYRGVKECRPILLTDSSADFTVSVVKKIGEEITLEFVVEKNMSEDVCLLSAMLTLELGEQMEEILYESSDFTNGRSSKTIVLPIEGSVGMAINGVLEYQICMAADEMEEAENDNVSLEPFGITILDLIHPMRVGVPERMEEIGLDISCQANEAATKIMEMTNLYLEAEESRMRLYGSYEGKNVVIDVKIESRKKFTHLELAVYCDDEELRRAVVSAFQ